jgi:signal transduction histidine kinase
MVYITSSVFCALLITIATQYMALQPILEDTRNRNVDAAVDNLVSLVANSLWVYNEEAAKEAADAILRDQFISGVIIHDHSDLFDYRIGELSDSDYRNPELEQIEKKQSANALNVIVPLIIESGGEGNKTFNIGTLEIQSNNQLISDRVNELALVTLASSIVIIITLQVIIYFMVHHIVAKPLLAFTEHVQILLTNLDDNVESELPLLKDRKDEIGRLAKTFHQQRVELIKRDHDLTDYREQLEQTVSERTKELRETNATLLESLDQLKKAQNELIQNEKLVSLGTLVSGIAHEVNTPLGIAITASSHLGEELRQTQKALSNNELTKTGFENFLNECHETETLLTSNLNRAATLIQSFKKVAVDQSSDEVRLIDVKEYLEEIILSMRPRLKHTEINIENNVPKNIVMMIAPGALAQIITNLVMNSILHGFDKGKNSGTITIGATLFEHYLELIYEDNGVGMTADTLKRVYDPFFTTTRSEGGSGLGMNIVYNLVTSKLNGAIETQSSPGKGLRIKMTIKI